MTRDDVTQWHRKRPYGARDEQYIDAVLAELKRHWLNHPRQRLGQLVCNLGRSAGLFEPFHMLDEGIMPPAPDEVAGRALLYLRAQDRQLSALFVEAMDATRDEVTRDATPTP